jgi:hypothetical protein
MSRRFTGSWDHSDTVIAVNSMRMAVAKLFKNCDRFVGAYCKARSTVSIARLVDGLRILRDNGESIRKKS